MSAANIWLVTCIVGVVICAVALIIMDDDDPFDNFRWPM